MSCGEVCCKTFGQFFMIDDVSQEFHKDQNIVRYR